MHLVHALAHWFFFFFFQAEDGIRDLTVTGVQTCALPIFLDAGEARALRDAWTFLRALERRLRLERDQPEEMLDPEHGGLVVLARSLGYSGSDDETVAALLADHARHRDAVRVVYDRRLGAAAT